MTTAFVEHVNLTVRDPEQSAQLMIDLFGWHIRWQGPAIDNGTSIHVGSATHYLSLYAPPEGTGSQQKFSKGKPLNHVGIVVDDLGAVEAKVKAAGLEPFSHGTYDPGGTVFYFFDENGIEFEVISYA